MFFNAMDANEILKRVLEITKESRAGLAKSIGLQPYRLQDIARGKSKEFPYEVADKIASTYPQINRDWLLTGKGEMLAEAEPSEADVEDLILTPANSIRFYPDLPATASNIEDMPQEAYPQYQLMYIQGYEGCLAIPATGRSMEPTIHAGDRIIHEPYLDRFIQNGEIYVICTTTGQRMIKRLVETSRDEDGIPTVTCHSDNPDKDLYAPFTLKGDEIRALYKVRLIIPLSL